MSEGPMPPMNDADAQTRVREYMAAFEARDVAKCLGFFADDATVDFQGTSYEGLQAIETWHKDRFEANLKVVRLESITVNGDNVVVDIVVSSDRLRAWNVKTLKGRITIRLEGGKFKEGKLASRMTNIFDVLRSGDGA